jgi:hypothetical protein
MPERYVPPVEETAALVHAIDQAVALVSELVGRVVDHWSDEDSICPHDFACLGSIAEEIGVALEENPTIVGMALQGAILLMARAKYSQAHPDADVGQKAV